MDPELARGFKRLPQMNVNDAIEEIAATGTGAWTGWCVVTLAMTVMAFAMQLIANSYVASCAQASFNVSGASIAMIPSVTFLGLAIGSLLIAPLADIIGRKEMLMYTSCGMALFGLLAPVAPNFMFLVFCRFLFGIFQGPWIVAVDFIVECVPKERRGMQVNYVTNVFWGVGTTGINILAWWVIPEFGWRCLLLLAALPLAVNVVLMWTLVESPLWLVSQGRLDDALKALSHMALMNGTTIPCSSLEPMPSHESMPLTDVPGDTDVPGTGGLCWFYSKQMYAEYHLLFSEGQRGILIPLILAWTFLQASYNMLMLYDGSVLGVVHEGPCQFNYVFNILISSSEILGGFAVAPLLDADHLSPWLGGRCGAQVVTFAVGGCALCLASIHVGGEGTLQFCAYLSRGLIKAGVGVMILQSAEVLDVKCRATGTSFLVMVGMASSALGSYWVYAPLDKHTIGLGISVCIFIGMIVMFLVPETARKELDRRTV